MREDQSMTCMSCSNTVQLMLKPNAITDMQKWRFTCRTPTWEHDDAPPPPSFLVFAIIILLRYKEESRETWISRSETISFFFFLVFCNQYRQSAECFITKSELIDEEKVEYRFISSEILKIMPLKKKNHEL